MCQRRIIKDLWSITLGPLERKCFQHVPTCGNFKDQTHAMMTEQRSSLDPTARGTCTLPNDRCLLQNWPLQSRHHWLKLFLKNCPNDRAQHFRLKLPMTCAIFQWFQRNPDLQTCAEEMLKVDKDQEDHTAHTACTASACSPMKAAAAVVVAGAEHFFHRQSLQRLPRQSLP